MALTVSDKELQELDVAQRPAVVVRHSRTKKGYAVMPEQVYDHARPLIEFVFAETAVPAFDQTEEWSDEKNARRAALINKKYDSRLSPAEERELATLQDEVIRYQERVAPIQNYALALILEALQARATRSPQQKP